MEKKLMCRICLAENVRMHLVIDTKIHELYERMTDIPFVTEDSRPMLACFVCYAKLQQCCQLQKKCLEADQLFTQIINEPNSTPLLNQDPVQFNGLVKTPVKNINILSVCQMERFTVKEEIPIDFERPGDIIEPTEEHLSDDRRGENAHNTCSDIERLRANQSKPDSVDVSSMKIEIEVEDLKEMLVKNRTVSDTQRTPVAKEPKLHLRRLKQQCMFPEVQNIKEQSNTTAIRNPEICTPITPKLKPHLRRINQKHVITEQKKNKEESNEKNIQNCTSTYEETVTFRQTEDSNTFLNTNSQSDSMPEDTECEETSKFIENDEKAFKCGLCSRHFTRMTNLRSHIRTHNSLRPYKCDICQRCFREEGYLVNHRLTHADEKPHKCEICQKSFNHKGNLTKHVHLHSGEKPFKCDVCQRFFSGKAHLTSHIRTHTDTKPHQCEICQKSFNHKGNLSKHVRLHTGVKPFKCEFCQRCFSGKAHLNIHIRTHTGEKPYKCEICQNSFSQNSVLTKHIRTHTGEKPYECEFCQRRFIQKGTLTRHLRNIHDKGP